MSFFSADDYRREYEKNQKKVKKAHWEVKHKYSSPNTKSDKTRWKFHCPRLCQQKENGGKGKKTFDGKICNKCGFEKIAEKP